MNKPLITFEEALEAARGIVNRPMLRITDKNGEVWVRPIDYKPSKDSVTVYRDAKYPDDPDFDYQEQKDDDWKDK